MLNSILENPLFNITFFGGFIFVLVGTFLYFFPSRKINSLYGYRTISSMKNQESWDFAQRYSAKILMRLGFALALFSSISLLTNFGRHDNLMLALALLFLTVVLLLFIVEREIKKKFRG